MIINCAVLIVKMQIFGKTRYQRKICDYNRKWRLVLLFTSKICINCCYLFTFAFGF